MTSLWTGRRVRLRGIEPDNWSAFMRFAVDEERLGDLLQPPRSAEGFHTWAKEQAAATSDGDCFVLAIEAVGTGKIVGSIGSHHSDRVRTGSSTASRSALISNKAAWPGR
ncbi:GNAT family N-acetyltransferase [Streptomyces sp. NBC_00500]|uniref:GNAT family N-acetyltransferase n=1 Tax=Streptomyces sp. NBC_00500 TaxID=2975762 RepID=UPI0030E2E61B